MNSVTFQDRTYRALTLLGILAFIASLPLTLASLLWLPAMVSDELWLGAATAALFVMMPVFQLALLRRASDLQRSDRIAQAKALIAGQLLLVAAIALWITTQ